MSRKPFYNFREIDKNTVEIAIYDEVSFFGVNAKDFYNQLKAANEKNIMLRINSPGGDVMDGLAIYNLLQSHKGDVEVHIDGMAASIASVIAMAGDRVVMPENTFLFVHDPLVKVGGNAEELRAMADQLDKVKGALTAAYVAKSGAKDATVNKWLADETLFTAKEAKDLGLADVVTAPFKAAAKANFAIADYFPSIANRIPPTAPADGGQQETQTKPTMSKFKDQAEAEARVTVLETEKVTMEKDHKSAIETAKNTALQEAKTAEKNRREGIIALRDKYNKDGDLNDATVKALSGDTTPEQFKDTVMEVIQNRGSKGAIRPGAKGADDNGAEDEESTEIKNQADFDKAYGAAKNHVERRKLVRAHRDFARAGARR